MDDIYENNNTNCYTGFQLNSKCLRILTIPELSGKTMDAKETGRTGVFSKDSKAFLFSTNNLKTKSLYKRNKYLIILRINQKTVDFQKVFQVINVILRYGGATINSVERLRAGRGVQLETITGEKRWRTKILGV
uniref:LAGLIDADG endonuclease n=1 Tax=Romanomermis culicivorax TaxID=13658 RepID=A0A915LAP6_ROMCU